MTVQPNQPRHPIDVLWQPATVLSILVAGELLAILLAVAPDTGNDRLARFGLLSFGVQWIALFTLAALYVLRHQLTRWRTSAIVALAVAILFSMTVLSSALAGILFRGLWIDQDANWLATGLRFFAAMLCMMLFGLVALRSHWLAQTQEYRAKKAELATLQARVDPHFLFNTLNTGIALVHARPDAAERLLLDLSDLFRAALAGPRTITLADELDLARRYLDIEQLRFGPRLQVAWNVPDALPQLLLPSLSIQPLVENAIHHGIEPRKEGGEVTVHVAVEDRHVVVEIGNPLPEAPSQRADRGHRVGQPAVAARLREAGGSFDAETGDDRYVARVRIPLAT